MIGSNRVVRVFAYAAPCDMRKSYEGLGGIVRNELEMDMLSGDMFVFTNRRRNRAKVLLFDGTGMCIYMKRLDKGQFAAIWKRTEDATVSLTTSELSLFLEGSKIIEEMPLSPSKIEANFLEICAEM